MIKGIFGSESAMKKLYAFYFSGTGNTRYVTERLCAALSEQYEPAIFDIAAGEVRGMDAADVLLFAYPVYGSSPTRPMRQFVYDHADFLRGKDVIVIVTQLMFSGDGAASLGRSIGRLGGNVLYAEHFNMPNNISDCTALKIKNGPELRETIERANRRIGRFARRICSGKPFRRGFNPVSHAVGYYCQRKYYRKNEQEKSGRLIIDQNRCIGCGKCVRNCPAGNILLKDRKAIPQGKCVLCYRCVNLCPKRAIRLFGKDFPQTQYRGIPASESDAKR